MAVMRSPSTWKESSTGLGRHSSDRRYVETYKSCSTASGNMIYIEHTTDFEFYSGNSAGAIQGYGYQFAESMLYTSSFISARC